MESPITVMERRKGPNPKLTAEEQRALIESYASGKLPVKSVAALFGISKQTLYKILEQHDVPLATGATRASASASASGPEGEAA